MKSSNSSFLGIKFVDLSDSTNVASSGTNVQTLTPPVGMIYQIISLYCAIPVISGASGDHDLEITNANLSSGNYLKIAGTDGALASISYNKLLADTENPSNEREQVQVILNQMICNNDNPIVFTYSNNSDTAQTSNRPIELIVKVYKELL